MAKKSMILKQQAPAKFSTRKYNRCKICGRPHAYLRNYAACGKLLSDFAQYGLSSARSINDTASPPRDCLAQNQRAVKNGATKSL